MSWKLRKISIGYLRPKRRHFVIDQLNTLEDDENDTSRERAEANGWLQHCMEGHKAILSLSNNHSNLNRPLGQSGSEIWYVHGGLTRLSLRSDNSFVMKGRF